jgi:SAM-dependent methyltransferase
MTLQQIKKAEKEYFEIYYHGDAALAKIDVEQFQRNRLQPCYATGTNRYTDNDAAFYDLVQANGGWADKVLLDFACGVGKWPVYYALTGARKVYGFDVAESGVRRGQNLAIRQDTANVVSLTVMDATEIGFRDNSFDIVIGNGVLHHVLKYPGVFDELWRVMKPGSRAYFHKGLADFPIFSLYWKMKGAVEEGDVPIHAHQIRRLAQRFSKVEIIGDTFLFSIKTFLWKPNADKITRFILRMCKNMDTVLFRIYPRLRAWGSFSYIILTK